MKGKRILIVDDEPRVAFVLSRALERSNKGYQVTVAHSGEEALKIMEHSPVDLLVTDLLMPGISGLKLIQQVRDISPKTVTILITAYGNDEIEAEARRLEAYRYIAKPFNLSDFTQAVEEALREVALTRPGLVVFSDESFETVARQLEDLRTEIGAQCIFLADMQGQQLVEAGSTQGLDMAALLALLGGGIAASTELARQLGDDHALNLNFHEGSRYDVYAATIESGLFLAIVCDRQAQPGRIGLVWLYTRRTIERLRSIFSSTPSDTPTLQLGDDFSSSLAAELDTWLTEDPGNDTPARPQEDTPSPFAGSNPKPPSMDSTERGEEKHPAEMPLLDLEAAIEQKIISRDLLLGTSPEGRYPEVNGR